MLARGCAWPLPITPMNTDGRMGMNKLTVGQVFGFLQVVTSDTGTRKNGHAVCRCACLCGAWVDAIAGNLSSGNTRSCGCLKTAIHTKHGMSGDTAGAYNSWVHMRSRCHSKSNGRYGRYGGRGLNICTRWSSFSAFLADMGPRPAGMSLGRIDNDGNYEPDNCRWETSTEQMRNTSRVRLDATKVAEIRASGESYGTLAARFSVDKRTISNVKLFKSWIK